MQAKLFTVTMGIHAYIYVRIFVNELREFLGEKHGNKEKSQSG